MAVRRNERRREQILELIASGERDVYTLALRFQVSPSTVRRDLQHLSGEKAVTRIYGGAMLTPPVIEEPYSFRAKSNSAGKRAIAKSAVEQLRDDEIIILDGGSTVAAMGMLLRERRLTVITNNMEIAAVLADAPGISLVLLGGTVRPISLSTYGPLAEDTLRGLTAAKLFVSADGLVVQRGLCEATIEQISLKRLMMQQAQETFVLADSSKLGCASQAVWAQLQTPWTLITDAQQEQWQPFFAQGGVRIIQVEHD